MKPRRAEASGAAGPAKVERACWVPIPRAMEARIRALYPAGRLDGVLVLLVGEALDRLEGRAG